VVLNSSHHSGRSIPPLSLTAIFPGSGVAPPFFGKFISNFLIAFVFTVLHKRAFYTSGEYIFLAVLFPLALAWGYIMQKTDSVWGSILFHAGMDIPVILGVFWNLS
jgi:membrane protease YdiL (CAAX protease family)